MSKTTRVLSAAGRGLGAFARGLAGLVPFLVGMVAAGAAAGRAESRRQDEDREQHPAYDPYARYSSKFARYDEDGHRIW